MDQDKNLKLFFNLYFAFANGNTSDKKERRFAKNLNDIFTENDSDIRIETNETTNYGHSISILKLGSKTISDNLIISLINFLFNLDQNMNIRHSDVLDIAQLANTFNSLSEEIDSKIRIIGYKYGYRGMLISLSKLE